jgi:hypothetical protein
MAFNKVLDKYDYNLEKYFSQIFKNLSPYINQGLELIPNDPKELENICKPDLMKKEIDKMKKDNPDNKAIQEYVDLFQQIKESEIYSKISPIIKQNPEMVKELFSEIKNSNYFSN